MLPSTQSAEHGGCVIVIRSAFPESRRRARHRCRPPARDNRLRQCCHCLGFGNGNRQHVFRRCQRVVDRLRHAAHDHREVIDQLTQQARVVAEIPRRARDSVQLSDIVAPLSMYDSRNRPTVETGASIRTPCTEISIPLSPPVEREPDSGRSAAPAVRSSSCRSSEANRCCSLPRNASRPFSTPDRIYTVSGNAHVAAIARQLPEVPESQSARRTRLCVALATPLPWPHS